MALSVLPLDLSRWDESGRDCLVLPVFKDDRPLRGAAGLADWRLCGRLSRLVKSNKATAEAGDAKGYTEERFRKDLAWMLGVVTKAGVTDWSLQLPGRASGLIGARRAIEIILEDQLLADQSITLIEDPAGQKDIAELLRSQR